MRPKVMECIRLLIPGKRLVISRMTRIVWLMVRKYRPLYIKNTLEGKYHHKIIHQKKDRIAAHLSLCLILLLLLRRFQFL